MRQKEKQIDDKKKRIEMENMRFERNRTEKIFKKFEMINSLDRE